MASTCRIILVAAALFCGGASVMGSPPNSSLSCRIVGGERLPAASGGTAALCAAIERAFAERGTGAGVTVEVDVLSSSMLSAKLSADGRTLPEQRFASMDRDLGVASFERFAGALAEQLAKARH
ncbi:MAG: hypothetical protein ACJ8E3_05380 [Sphingomicrobium sp.]